MAQNTQLIFDDTIIYPETSADCVIYKNSTLKKALDDSGDSAISSIGKKILACNNLVELRNLLRAGIEPVIYDETENQWAAGDGVCIIPSTYAKWETALYTPAGSAATFRVAQPAAQFTIDFFMTVTSESSGTNCFHITASNVSLYLAGMNANNTAFGYTSGSTWKSVISTAKKLNTNTRNFHRLTYSSGTWKWYVNGSLVGSGTQTITRSAPISIVLGGTNITYFDEFRFLNDNVLTTSIPAEPFTLEDYPGDTISLAHFNDWS